MGQVYGVLAWSPDARHWEYISPEQSFVPLGRLSQQGSSDAASGGSSDSGSTPDFDCCGVFMAKQNPTETEEYLSAATTPLLLYYAGSNGAFFGPRGGALGVAYVGRHAFAGLAGAAVVVASAAQVQSGTLRVTASGAVRVAVTGVGKLSFEHCVPINGTEVVVQWLNASLAGSGSVPLAEFVGGAVGLSFDVPTGSVLYAYHV